MAAGTVALIVAVLTLAWTKELINVLRKESAMPSKASTTAIICFATFWVYVLNIAIQPIQAGIRSLIIEYCPHSQQSQANTYASVMQGIGNIVGYLFAFGVSPLINLDGLIPFQKLAIFASVVLAMTVSLSLLTIVEKPYNPLLPEDSRNRRPFSKFRNLFWTYFEMPKDVRKVFHIQFLAWMGWFPFLYYSTTYVGEFYAGKRMFSNLVVHATEHPSPPDDTSSIAQEAIRYGTFASFLFAVVTFVFNLALSSLLDCFARSRCSKHPALSKKKAIVAAWRYSHLFFAILMFSTFLVHSEAAATAVVALAGLSWALTLFAPFAIIGFELAPIQRRGRRPSHRSHRSDSFSSDDNNDDDDNDDDDD